jgi:hypothetical protein
MLDSSDAYPNQKSGYDNQQATEDRNWIVDRLLNDSPNPIFVSFVLALCISAIGVALNFKDGSVYFWLGVFLIFIGLATMI